MLKGPYHYRYSIVEIFPRAHLRMACTVSVAKLGKNIRSGGAAVRKCDKIYLA